MKEKLKRDFQLIRDQYELANLGNYELIYPTQDELDLREYQRLLDSSRDIWEI